MIITKKEKRKNRLVFTEQVLKTNSENQILLIWRTRNFFGSCQSLETSYGLSPMGTSL